MAAKDMDLEIGAFKKMPEKTLTVPQGEFREIGQRVGRNQATVMWICYGWMQEETTDQRNRSLLLRCTTARDDR
ncbi:hypothetical protein TNCV_4083441 [Trichonephila clavipes]|nr:hypothetical protein TNCV_4083441 [Trichonephila clavipes]